jgi:hypothetical protein
MNPVGKGQESPNVNPYLPPPVGRMRLTANPIFMLKELVGPKMCLRIACLCCCLACVMLIGVFGGTIMSTLTFIEEMNHNGGGGTLFTMPDWPHVLNGTTANSSASMTPSNTTMTITPVVEPASTRTSTSPGSPEEESDEKRGVILP